MTNIRENLHVVEEQISSACRDAGRDRSSVELMAVSKAHPAAAMLEAFAAGQRLFGENRVQEFGAKRSELLAGDEDFPARVHFIGNLQTNKAPLAAGIFSSIDSVDSWRLAERLDQSAAKLGGSLDGLLEVKLSPEPQKHGLEPGSAEFELLLERLPDLRHLRIGGLMTVPPFSEDPEASRPYFRQLRELRDVLARQHPRLALTQLSMGMSGDFTVAIEEGSTCVRVGTAIFGKRMPPVA